MIPAQTSLKGAFKRIIIRYRFEQNVCKALKVREFRGFAIRMASISTEFSTSFVENDTGLVTPIRPGVWKSGSVGKILLI